MPTQTSAVGALTLPVPAGIAQAKFEDPVVEALLDFLAFYLNNDLSAKLAQLGATSATAVKAATDVDNFRSTNDPFEPRGPHAVRHTPALHVWWDGNSAPFQIIQAQKGRVRDIQALYIFDEYPAPAEMVRRSGLFAAVDASFAKAASRGYHPSYSYNSKPLGTHLEDSIGDFATWDWEYLGGRGIKRIGIDEPNQTKLGLKVSGRDRPGFAGLFRVRELIQPTQPTVGDVLTDSPVTLNNDGVEIMDRTFEPDDGDCAEP